MSLTRMLGLQRGVRLDAYSSPVDMALGGLLLVVAIAIPFVSGISGDVTNIAQYVAIYMLLAIGLNIIVGYTGLLELGYVMFIAVGAVIAALMIRWSHSPTPQQLGVTGMDGPVVTSVATNSPVADPGNRAQETPLMVGDRILLYDDDNTMWKDGELQFDREHVVESLDDLTRHLGERPQGSHVVLVVDRDGSREFVDIDQVSVDQLTGPVMAFDGAYLLILLVCGLVCMVLAVIRGLPTLRVTGDYYAIVTLGFAEVIFEFFLWGPDKPLNMSAWTGGAEGLQWGEANRPVLFGTALKWDTHAFYFLLVFCVLVAFLVSHHLNRSRVGRAFASIRIDETAARACGVNVERYKLASFAVAGFIGGVGGGLFAVWNNGVAVRDLDVWQSILVLGCVVLGGMGSLRGVALGSIVLISLGEILKRQMELPLIGPVGLPQESRFMIYGIVLIVVMRFRPQGLLPPVRQGRELDADARHAMLHQTAPLFTLQTEAGLQSVSRHVDADGNVTVERDGESPPDPSSPPDDAGSAGSGDDKPEGSA